MKIACAPASFKETLTATEAAQAMARGIERTGQEISVDICPIGDGGEGTMDALINAMGGEYRTITVKGPLGVPVDARLGIVETPQSNFPLDSLAPGAAIKYPLGIVELAQASGLDLVPPQQRDPMHTTTFGTGELIRAAIDQACQCVIVCIGGSATVDGGMGIAQALGVKFFDSSERLLADPLSGKDLKRTGRIELIAPAKLPEILVACDVINPLCGPTGAATVYGPQKGATPEQVKELDQGLAHLAKLLRRDPYAPGAGAAGGAGFGLMAMCNAQLERGIELVLRVVNFEIRCKGAALVLTGEGRLDCQSLHGKACMGVANAAAKIGVPTIAIVGSTGEGAQDCANPAKGGMLKTYISLADRFGIERALGEPARLIEQVAFEIAQNAVARRRSEQHFLPRLD